MSGRRSITLRAELGDRGLWYVTSPDEAGLLVAGRSLDDALGRVSAALDDLDAARVVARQPAAESGTEPGERCDG